METGLSSVLLMASAPSLPRDLPLTPPVFQNKNGSMETGWMLLLLTARALPLIHVISP